jgi:hypothetical protein
VDPVTNIKKTSFITLIDDSDTNSTSKSLSESNCVLKNNNNKKLLNKKVKAGTDILEILKKEKEEREKKLRESKQMIVDCSVSDLGPYFNPEDDFLKDKKLKDIVL